MDRELHLRIVLANLVQALERHLPTLSANPGNAIGKAVMEAKKVLNKGQSR